MLLRQVSRHVLPAGHLYRLLFSPIDGGRMLLRNVAGTSTGTQCPAVENTVLEGTSDMAELSQWARVARILL
jgi:hypothetical protein